MKIVDVHYRFFKSWCVCVLNESFSTYIHIFTNHFLSCAMRRISDRHELFVLNAMTSQCWQIKNGKSIENKSRLFRSNSLKYSLFFSLDRETIYVFFRRCQTCLIFALRTMHTVAHTHTRARKYNKWQQVCTFCVPDKHLFFFLRILHENR